MRNLPLTVCHVPGTVWVLSTEYHSVPSIALSTSHLVIHVTLTKAAEVVSSLQMRELKHREIKELA